MSSETSTPAREPLKSTQIGKVVSDKRDKTCKVEVGFLVKAPKYEKRVRRRSVFHVHDEKNEAGLGDTVQIAPCRPISKTKSWRLIRVVEKAVAEVATAGEGS